MRVSMYSFICVLFFSLIISAQTTSWIKVNPKTADYFNDVHTFNSTKAIAVGSYGSIYMTTDGGTNWAPIISPVTDDLKDVFFIDGNTGWIVGGTDILKSTDGGITWNNTFSGFSFAMNSLFFIDANTGWAAGAYGDIWKTTDGGANWTDQIPSGSQLTFGWFYSIYFTDANHGFAVGSSAAFGSTTDGGANWSIGDRFGGPWHSSIFFTDPQNGWIVSHDEQPQRTTDGGVNWGTANPNITLADFGNEYMQKVFFTSPSVGYIAGNNGKFASTQNGTAANPTWTVSTIGSGENYFGLSFNGSTGWVAGNGGVIQSTTDSGVNWHSDISTATTNNLNAVFFINSSAGWAVGAGGTVIKTTDGGDNWTSVNIGTTNTLNDVYFSSANIGYIVGDLAFYYTGDGGVTWTARTISNEYYGVRFITDNVGWIVGSTANGKMFKTTNRGISWTNAVANSPLFDVEIVDASSVVAAGFDGLIMRTSDGGSNWNSISSGTTDILNSISFVNPSDGFIFADGANSGDPKILGTTDGGATWSKVASTSGQIFNDIHFLDQSEGWAAGQNSATGDNPWHTTDGGVTWSSYSGVTRQTLNAVYFPNSTIGFAVGDNGTILRETTVLPPQPPACADNVNPLPNDIDIPISTNWFGLYWQDGGGAAPTGYKLYFGTDGGGITPPANIVNGTDLGLVTNWSSPTDLSGNTTYYWQIVPYNNNGSASNCPIWSFTTRKALDFGGGGLTAPGYFFANSLPGASAAPSQPVYGWIDPIAGGHTAISSWTSGNSDDGYFSASIGFSFPFFGVNYSSLYIGTNGLLTFGSGYSGKGTGASIPDAAAPNNMIAALLMDLALTDGGGGGGPAGNVYYGTSGSNFVVTWSHVYAAGTSDYMTFQVILSSNGDIQFQYNDTQSISVPAPPTVDNIALIGIEDQFGSQGVQYRNMGVGGNIFGSPNAVKFGNGDGALPVELNSFTADIMNGNVILNWQTAAEVNNYGFEIARSGGKSDGWEKIGFVQGAGNSNSPKSYSFTDINPSGKYGDIIRYRLKQIDIDGSYEYSDIIEVEVGNAPAEFELLQNYPNPFNPATNIRYSLPNKAKVILTVFDLLGKEVAELVNEEKPAGRYTVQFNGSNLASGIYFYRLNAGDFIDVKKLILIK